MWLLLYVIPVQIDLCVLCKSLFYAVFWRFQNNGLGIRANRFELVLDTARKAGSSPLLNDSFCYRLTNLYDEGVPGPKGFDVRIKPSCVKSILILNRSLSLWEVISPYPDDPTMSAVKV